MWCPSRVGESDGSAGALRGVLGASAVVYLVLVGGGHVTFGQVQAGVPGGLVATPGVVQGAAPDAAASAAARGQVSVVPAGDPVVGRALFLGGRRLQNGAPSCRACHSVAGVGALGGGALGPDLTGTYEKFGAQGLATILAAMPFPTMRPVFDRRPLTAEEQAALLAFLAETGAERPAPVLARVAGLVVGAGLVLLGLGHAAWRDRLRGVRRPLVRGSTRVERR